MSNSAIFIDNLFKRFGDITAVNGVSLNVWSGEFFGLLGPNGAGKTTIINILSRLLKPTSGYAIIGGYDA
ncbi:MAG: ATP-binding cassette domain-containing protein [Candidatus Methanomethylicia archaeon]